MCEIEESLQSADHLDLAVFATSSTLATRQSILINGVCLDILVDTGAEVNVLLSSAVVPTDLQLCTVAVQAWGKFNIPVCGKVTCDVNYKGKTIRVEFIIVTLPKDRNTMLPLFSHELCQRLGMIHELLQVSNINVFKDYNDLFTGLGVLNTGFEYKVPIDNTVPAKNVPARRLHLRL